ncbi:MAG: hypothetical protein JNN27_13475 [Planctomycetes bacterium]|nr:hypothetical protein [Planctomycetota bacterium]
MQLALTLLAVITALVPQQQLTVRVVDDTTSAPVAGAEVRLVEHAEVERTVGRTTPVTEVDLWERARQRTTLRAKTDAAGHVVLARPAGLLAVSAYAPEMWGETFLVQPETSEVEVRLASDFQFSGRVVNERGAAVAGVPVALLSRPVESARAASFIHWRAVATSDESGIASFPHAQRLTASHPSMSLTLALGIPLREPVEIALDATALPNEPPVLVLPPCGRIEIALEPARNGDARLRAATLDARRPSAMWSNYAPWRMALVDGRASFPHVGLGVALELELNWKGLATPLTEQFDGPHTAGETVVHSVGEERRTLAIHATLVDEKRAPLGQQTIWRTLTVHDGSSTSSVGGELRTDGLGRATLEIVVPREKTAQVREIKFSTPDGASAEPLEAIRVLSREFEPGILELGTIALAAPGSDVLVRGMDDDALELEYRRWLDLRSRNGIHERGVEVCLGEMARRGGERWIKLLGDELRETQRRRTAHEIVVNDHDELVLLTCLRRAQRRPDPARLVLRSASQLRGPASALPPLRFEIRNVDPELAFEFSTDSFLRLRAEIVDAQGVAAVRRPPPSVVRGGPATQGALQPGKGSIQTFGHSLHLGIAWDFEPLAPGEYTVTVLYSPVAEIAFSESARGWIVVRAEPVTLHVE